jgi:hypothetical protein
LLTALNSGNHADRDRFHLKWRVSRRGSARHPRRTHRLAGSAAEAERRLLEDGRVVVLELAGLERPHEVDAVARGGCFVAGEPVRGSGREAQAAGDAAVEQLGREDAAPRDGGLGRAWASRHGGLRPGRSGTRRPFGGLRPVRSRIRRPFGGRGHELARVEDPVGSNARLMRRSRAT